MSDTPPTPPTPTPPTPTPPTPTPPTPTPPTPAPAPGPDSSLQETVNGLVQTVTGLVEVVSKLGGQQDSHPVKRPWTAWGSRRDPE